MKMYSFENIAEMIQEAEMQKVTLGQLVARGQAEEMDMPETALRERMSGHVRVMREAIVSGLQPGLQSASGLSGGDAALLIKAAETRRLPAGGTFTQVLANALAVSEWNACMGRIVAAPTAGSCGILPAVLLTLADAHDISEDALLDAMFTAAGIGLVVARQASISGAEGGCQAECGSASAMAAAAATELMGGTPSMAGHAAAIAMKAVLGLVCDPVAGLVEVPCVKRNAAGAANALTAATLALAGIQSVIPVDEVIGAMGQIGSQMPSALRETAEGGLAVTPTGKKLAGSAGRENSGGCRGCIR